MAGGLHAVRSKDDLRAEFSSIVPPINGEITLKELIHVWKHCKRCVQHTETNYDTQNVAWLPFWHQNTLMSITGHNSEASVPIVNPP